MHSDVSDMMVAGGLVGFALLALRYWTLWRAIRLTPMSFPVSPDLNLTCIAALVVVGNGEHTART